MIENDNNQYQYQDNVIPLKTHDIIIGKIHELEKRVDLKCDLINANQKTNEEKLELKFLKTLVLSGYCSVYCSKTAGKKI